MKHNLFNKLYYVDLGTARHKTHVAQANDDGVLVVPCKGKPLSETPLSNSSLSVTMRTKYWCKRCMLHLVDVMLAHGKKQQEGK